MAGNIGNLCDNIFVEGLVIFSYVYCFVYLIILVLVLHRFCECQVKT